MTLERAKEDIKRIIKTGGFEVDATLKHHSGTPSVNIKVTASKHHNSIDSDGLPSNTKNVHITLVESDLTDESYPVRNANGEVSLLNHLVDYADSTGNIKNYSISETFPDETLGIIVCILNDYNGS